MFYPQLFLPYYYLQARSLLQQTSTLHLHGCCNRGGQESSAAPQSMELEEDSGSLPSDLRYPSQMVPMS